jgi:hypothetical protein
MNLNKDLLLQNLYEKYKICYEKYFLFKKGYL